MDVNELYNEIDAFADALGKDRVGDEQREQLAHILETLITYPMSRVAVKQWLKTHKQIE